MVWLLRILKVAAFSFGGLLMAAAGVSPTDASSNLSEWAKLIGLDQLAIWLAPDVADRWGMIFGAATVVLVVTITFWPRLLVLCSRLNQYNVIIQRKDNRGTAAQGELKDEHLSPLSEAAQYAYEQTLDSPAAAMAERPIDNEQPSVLHWYARAIFGSTHDGATLYGTRPYSSKLEKVPSKMLQSCDFSENLNALIERTSKIIKYENLVINRNELAERIKIIQGWGA